MSCILVFLASISWVFSGGKVDSACAHSRVDQARAQGLVHLQVPGAVQP